MAGLKNLNVDVSEENGDVAFLHKIVEGSASRSYGIHVAKLAGVPASLLERAEVKLKELEEGKMPDYEEPRELETACEKPAQVQEQQLSFFSFAPNPVIQKLKELDLMSLTPSQAFQILEELKAAAEQ